MDIEPGIYVVVGFVIIIFVGMISTLISIFTEPDFPEPAKVVKKIPKVSDNMVEGIVLFKEDDNFRLS